MSRLTQSTTEKISTFELLAHFFEYLWREAGYSATPKLHMLEIHVVDDLRRFGCTGLFAEQVIEREHHNQHVADVQFQCFTSWTQRNQLIRERTFVHSSPAVQRIVRETVEKNKKTVNKIKQEENEEKKKKQSEETEDEISHILTLARDWNESRAKLACKNSLTRDCTVQKQYPIIVNNMYIH